MGLLQACGARSWTAGRFRSFGAIVALVLCVVDAAAVTVGRPRGAALIGRPLSFVVPVTLDAGEQDPCVRAELFQGDTRVSGASSRLERGVDGGMQVRVSSPTVLEEPVVTLYLSVGCAQQVTRRFVVLAEHPDAGGDQAPAAAVAPASPRAVPVPVPGPTPRAPAAATPAVPPAPRVAPLAPGAATPPGAQSPARPAPGPRADSPRTGGLVFSPSLGGGREAPAARGSREAPAESRSPRRAAPADERSAGRARLRLEPLDLSIDYAPALRISSELLSLRTVTPQQRAEAAALWQALNMSPEDLQRQGRRVQQMEADMGRLRMSVQQNGAALAQVGQQLEKARTERNLAALALLLVAGLMAAVAALWWWKRSRDSRPAGRWWHGDVTTARDEMDDASMPAPLAARPASAPAAAKAKAKAQAIVAAAATAAVPAADGAVATAARAQPDSSGNSDFMPSHPGHSMRMVKAEELIDIQQQADFFTTIGQHEQAIALLETHIHDHQETSPVAWLDLLGLYHRLGRRDDYERIRDSFHQSFNGQVPAFDAYRTESMGLEDYRRALSRIVALWPSPRVLEVIEESIFRKPDSPGAEPFDLQAYRDLLLLYNVAKEVLSDAGTEDAEPFVRSSWPGSDGGPPSIGGFSQTGLQQLPALRADELTTLQPLSARRSDEVTSLPPLEQMDIPPASANLGLDIDLDALPPPEGEPIGAKHEGPMMTFDFDLAPQERRDPENPRS